MIGKTTRGFIDGLAEFTGLVVATAGLGYRLHFSLLTPATGRPVEVVSMPFDVVASKPDRLVFLQHPPEEIVAGAPFTVTVVLMDNHGNASPGTHSIELRARDDESVLSGLLGTTVAQTDPQYGTATFRNVAFERVRGLVYLEVKHDLDYRQNLEAAQVYVLD